MKFLHILHAADCGESHPSRGAWIEICDSSQATNTLIASHPSRGAWIEIAQRPYTALARVVAPLAGCVD